MMKNPILFLLLSSSLTAGTIIQFGGDEGIITDSNHISQIGGGTQVDQIIDWLGNSSVGGSASGIMGGETSRLPGAVLTSETYDLTLTSVSVAGTGATGTRSSGNPNVLGVDAVDAAKFDAGTPNDAWTFEFNEGVKLRQLVFSALNFNGETVKIAGAVTASFTRLDANMAAVTYGAETSNRYVYTFPTPVDIAAGTEITLESTQGSWGLQGVVVEFDYQPPAPVDPDPFEPNPDGGVEPTAQNPLKPAPNVIIFIADDMGIGDTSAYQDLTGNADAVQIDTPEMERLADMGTRFTDVHTNAATCTPTRIALLSGTYSLRSPLKTAAANTTHINGVIMPGKRTTIAHMMQRSGYASYGYGKWHMAMKGDAGTDADDDGVFEVQSTGILYEGPIEMGFDTYTGTPGNFSYTGAMIQDRQFMRFNNAAPNDYTLVPVNDPSNVPWDGRGPSSPTDPNLFKIQPATFEKLQVDLTGHIANKGDQPFFIYYASHSNHDPYVPANFDSTTDPDNPTASLNGITITPNITKAGAPIPVVTGPDLNGDGIPDPDYGANPDWIWSDPLREKWWDHVTFMNAADTAITVNGPTSRAMMVRENDIIVGYMLDFLEATDDPRNPGYKLIDNTIFIFTSDNGSDIKSEAAAGAMPAASDILNPANYDVNGKILPSVPKQDIRAFKGTRYEGGSRVPFIASWPDPGDPLQTNGIPAGKTSPAVFGLQDVYATIAEAIGHQLHEQEAVDSESLLTAWTDPLQNTVTVRSTDMLSKYQRFVFSRRGQLKLAADDASFPGSLANNTQGNNDRFANNSTLDFLDMDHVDLFDLDNDLPETTDTDPSGSSGDAISMLADMQTYLTQGFSRAGAAAFENGVNFIGGDLLTDANWHAYKTSRNGIAAGSTTPGIIAIDGTATGDLVNRTYVHRAGTITYTPSSGGLSGSLYELDGGTLNVDEDLRMSNSRLEAYRGTIGLGANNLALNGTNCVVIVSGGDINAAQLSIGEDAGSTDGFKIVRFKSGAGTLHLTGANPIGFGDDGSTGNDFIDFVTGARGRLVTTQDASYFSTLWDNGQLRIDGVAGTVGQFGNSDFKLIELGDGRNALVLEGGQVLEFDFDDDRISDIWEQERVGAMDILSLSGDHDGDGILDREEYILDFDPTTPDSPFAASITWNSGNSVDIRFGSKASRNYLVQFASDLTTSEWMTLNYEVGTDGVFNFNDDPQGSTRGFYKVQVFLP